MTQEDKILLLKDLCARLPYMPKIKITYQQQGIKGTDEGNVSCDVIEHIVNDLRNGVITDVQIYLRPISSMTEKEKKEYENCYQSDDTTTATLLVDFYNKKHFDHRGLIEKGLAIEVTKENNPYK